MHVAVDLDDVTLEFMHGVLHAFETEYGVKVDYDGASWGPRAVAFTKHPLLLESGYKNWWGWLRDREWLWAQFPAVPGAIGGIKRLRAAGHYVEAVTSKPEWAEHNVWKWLGRWRPAFHRVTIVSPGQAKLDFTEAKVIIDDKYETCLDFAANGRYGIWFDRATPSRPSPHTPRLLQATDWEHVITIVKAIEEGTL